MAFSQVIDNLIEIQDRAYSCLNRVLIKSIHGEQLSAADREQCRRELMDIACDLFDIIVAARGAHETYTGSGDLGDAAEMIESENDYAVPGDTNTSNGGDQYGDDINATELNKNPFDKPAGWEYTCLPDSEGAGTTWYSAEPNSSGGFSVSSHSLVPVQG